MKTTVTRLNQGNLITQPDMLADEEPLQITLDGVPIAVVMRTPGNDYELTIGFLITEGILQDPAEIDSIDLEREKNHAYIFLNDDVHIDHQKLKRNLYSASSCGICGKASIESIRIACDHRLAPIDLHADVILAAPDQLREAQSLFEQTGGIHAAGLLRSSGELLAVREDVGRHNAIDKVVQKAYLARIPAVTAISAPTSLAVEFARETNMHLYGFVRNGSYNHYT